MEIQEAISGRRSIRKYTKEDVADDDIGKILEAGRWAPSGLNNQPWMFMVLRGNEKDSIAKYTKYCNIINGAPVCIAVFLDGKAGYDRTKDVLSIGACIQNMLLAIHGIRLGSVWLGEILKRRVVVERELNVRHELMAVIAIGHPAERRSSERKEIGELMVWSG